MKVTLFLFFIFLSSLCSMAGARTAVYAKEKVVTNGSTVRAASEGGSGQIYVLGKLSSAGRFQNTCNHFTIHSAFSGHISQHAELPAKYTCKWSCHCLNQVGLNGLNTQNSTGTTDIMPHHHFW